MQVAISSPTLRLSVRLLVPRCRATTSSLAPDASSAASWRSVTRPSGTGATIAGRLRPQQLEEPHQWRSARVEGRTRTAASKSRCRSEGSPADGHRSPASSAGRSGRATARRPVRRSARPPGSAGGRRPRPQVRVHDGSSDLDRVQARSCPRPAISRSSSIVPSSLLEARCVARSCVVGEHQANRSAPVTWAALVVRVCRTGERRSRQRGSRSPRRECRNSLMRVALDHLRPPDAASRVAARLSGRCAFGDREEHAHRACLQASERLSTRRVPDEQARQVLPAPWARRRTDASCRRLSRTASRPRPGPGLGGRRGGHVGGDPRHRHRVLAGVPVPVRLGLDQAAEVGAAEEHAVALGAGSTSPSPSGRASMVVPHTGQASSVTRPRRHVVGAVRLHPWRRR